MNDEAPDLIIDRVGEREWQIFLSETQGSPTVYFVYTVPVAGPLNWQVILTVYDAAAAADHELPIFDIELFSTAFYASDEKQFENMMVQIFDVLNETDINNPVELSHIFGGTVRSHSIQTYTLPDTH
jgi:hypothetical protein